MTIKTFTLPPYDINEILRYTGDKTKNSQTIEVINDCLKELDNNLTNKVAYDVFDLKITDNLVDLSFIKIENENFAKFLKGSIKAVCFVSTIGLYIDRLINKYSNLSPLKALCFEAIGTERIEALCDEFCEFLKKEYSEFSLTKRFSPGYSNLPLSMQKDIFRVLTPHKIGLTLNDSLVMSPSKSVSAIVGIKNKNSLYFEEDKCNSCLKKDCVYRR